MNVSILPSSSTDFERTLEEACDVVDILRPAIAEIAGIKFHRPLNPSVAPSLVIEYGLGPIAEFFDAIEELIDQGRPWQAIRGTPHAKHLALAWIGYDAISIEDQNPGRRRWHLQTIHMGELPTAQTEDERLAKAEYLVDLSNRARTVFFRGYHGYDVRALRFGKSTWGNAIWGDSSGVRINGGEVKWSHGRTHAITGKISSTFYATLGINFVNGDQPTWNSQAITWETPGISWDGVTDADAVRAWFVQRQRIFFDLRDQSGLTVGYARCFDLTEITGTAGYTNGKRYMRAAAVVPFGASPGAVVASVGIVTGGVLAAGAKAGRRWFAPEELTFSAGKLELISNPLAIDLMKTCRELITVVMEI